MPGLKGSFLIAVLAGAAAVLGWAEYIHLAHPPPPDDPSLKHLAGEIWVSEQIKPFDLRQLKAEHFVAVIDLRPDGEVAGQPSSEVMAQAARKAGLAFTYDPVPHGDIPDAAVVSLQHALAAEHGRVLLYCRSGRRAARTWALAEASRSDGLDGSSIRAAVQGAGQPVDDLDGIIEARIAARP